MVVARRATDTADAVRWLRRPVESGAAAGFGIYLHVPFCSHRCGYCDFATRAVGDVPVAQRDGLYDRYVEALVADVGGLRTVPADVRPPDDAWPTVTSVFVGGGTPSLIGAARLARILEALRARFVLAVDAEITVECNPETATPALFDGLAAAGVTRVSLGAQSFAPGVLATLERAHTPGRAVAAVDEARAAGVRQVSIDLIYGTPGESAGDWTDSLAAVLGAGVDHVSAYALTVHDNTALGSAVATGRVADVDDDVQRERFEVARTLLARAGFRHYEVSNWARGDGSRSRHNTLYWRHGDYLGFGVGAHAHRDGVRWWTTRSTERYLEAIAGQAPPPVTRETLDDDERAIERLMLGLRLAEGLHPVDAPPIDPIALESALDDRLVELSCGRLRCAEGAWFLLDEAVRRLLVSGVR